MAIVGSTRSYYKKFSFQVEIAGVAFAGFQKAGPLKMTVAKVEQWEGGAIIPNKSPGRVTVEDCVLERGATKDRDLWDWMKQVANIAKNGGVVDPRYKRDIDVVQLERDGTELVRHTLHNAFPVVFEAGDWDNTADANVMESVTLTYDYFDPSDDSDDNEAATNSIS